jgi:hypothetical protein
LSEREAESFWNGAGAWRRQHCREHSLKK